MVPQPISGSDVPASYLPFSPGLRVGPWLLVSGQASVGRQGNIVPGTFEEEMRRSFENVERILTAAGMSFRDVVQVRSYVGRQEDLAEYNRLYRQFFSEPFPARTTLIGCLGKLLKFEVDVVAYREPTNEIAK